MKITIKVKDIEELDNRFRQHKEDLINRLEIEIQELKKYNKYKETVKKNKIIQELESKVKTLQDREGKRFSEDFQMAIDILKRYGYIEYEINSFFDENIRRSKEFIIRLNTNM